MSFDTDRSKCIRMLEAQGASVPAFLKAAQPELDGLTGAQLLQDEPERLLAALQERKVRLTHDPVDELLAEIRNTQQED